MKPWTERPGRRFLKAKMELPRELRAGLGVALDEIRLDPEGVGDYDDDEGRWYFETERPRFEIEYSLRDAADPQHRTIIWHNVVWRAVPIRISLVFLSYSHDDGDWYLRVANALQILRRQDIELLSDGDLYAAQEWHPQIAKKVGDSNAALALVSRSFLESEYIREHELKTFLARAKSPEPYPFMWLPLLTMEDLKELAERVAEGRTIAALQVLDRETPLDQDPTIDQRLRELPLKVAETIYEFHRRQQV